MTSQADTGRRLLAHYEQDGLLERIDTGLTALGEAPAKPSLESLSPVDEFHIRGAAATGELIDHLGVGSPRTGCRIRPWRPCPTPRQRSQHYPQSDQHVLSSDDAQWRRTHAERTDVNPPRPETVLAISVQTTAATSL